MPRRAVPGQSALPFDAVSDATTDEKSPAQRPADEPPRRGRPRVWDSEADRKRAYRERLAVDNAEPGRLRRELRVERKLVAEKAREVTRLRRQLDRLRVERANATARETELKASVDALEERVEFWRSQASTLEKRVRDERERQEQAPPRQPNRPPQPPRQLPDLRLQQGSIPPDRPPGKRRK